MFDAYPMIRKQTFDPQDLFLAFDGLRDDHTLLDIPVTESPHAGIMQALETGKDMFKTDYSERAMNGTLDMRYNQRLSRRKMEKAFQLKKKEVQQDTYAPVKVSIFNGHNYIIDGKHTTALCYVNSLKVRCIIVQNPFLDSFYCQLYKKIKKRGKKYKKGIAFFEIIYKQNDEN